MKYISLKKDFNNMIKLNNYRKLLKDVREFKRVFKRLIK